MKQLVSIYKQNKETQNNERLWKFCCGWWQMMSQAAAARLQTRKCNVCCIWILLFVYPSNKPSGNIQASFPFNLIGHLNKSLIYIYTSFTSCKLLRTTSCCTLYGILIYRFYCVKVDSRYIHAVCCAVLATLWNMEWDGRFGKVSVGVSTLCCSNITLNQFCSICDNVTEMALLLHI